MKFKYVTKILSKEIQRLELFGGNAAQINEIMDALKILKDIGDKRKR